MNTDYISSIITFLALVIGISLLLINGLGVDVPEAVILSILTWQCSEHFYTIKKKPRT